MCSIHCDLIVYVVHVYISYMYKGQSRWYLSWKNTTCRFLTNTNNKMKYINNSVYVCFSICLHPQVNGSDPLYAMYYVYDPEYFVGTYTHAALYEVIYLFFFIKFIFLSCLVLIGKVLVYTHVCTCLI